MSGRGKKRGMVKINAPDSAPKNSCAWIRQNRPAACGAKKKQRPGQAGKKCTARVCSRSHSCRAALRGTVDLGIFLTRKACPGVRLFKSNSTSNSQKCSYRMGDLRQEPGRLTFFPLRPGVFVPHEAGAKVDVIQSALFCARFFREQLIKIAPAPSRHRIDQF